MDGISLGHLVVADQALWAVQMPPPGCFHKSGDTCSPQTTDNLSIYAEPGQRPKSQTGKGDPPPFWGREGAITRSDGVAVPAPPHGRGGRHLASERWR